MSLARQGAKENAYIEKISKCCLETLPHPLQYILTFLQTLFFLDAALDPPCASRDGGTVGN